MTRFILDIATSALILGMAALPFFLPPTAPGTPALTQIVFKICLTDNPGDTDLIMVEAPRTQARWCVVIVPLCKDADMVVYKARTPDPSLNSYYVSKSKDVCQ